MAIRQPLAPDLEPALRWDATQRRLLDAAEELIRTRGVHGLTIAELARTAGLSRPTVYRSWSGADEVVRATLLRRVLVLLAAGDQAAATRADIVAEVMRFAAALGADPLFAALLEREPEVFTRYMLQRFGTSQRVILSHLSSAIAVAQAGGSVRQGASDEIAVMLLLIAQSAILSHGTVSDLLDRAAWTRELAAALDGHLRP
ncbi:helix-turn-helix domain-containing protein [Microbacterium capsulatum]|uniref:Helix-turn-helix domain-containing protein n=1 Tax=Microbacterium capsulatum TaxID=3041921 RepID=A0ABU0XC73_9MICO|nr:helix-turn-helix domain-containing protein [Microbacterium sp. ASV81]MDQ4212716.1 helix-turn-helix domain-containing protein [Microbacterium sp. ASV81]